MTGSWEIKNLDEICHKITDGSHNPPKGIDLSEFIMLSSKNVANDNIHYEKPRYLNEIDFNQENKRTNVEAGDVLLTIVGTIGRVAVVPQDHKKFTLQRSVAVLKINKGKVTSRFLMFSLQNILDFLNSESRGVAQKGIYLKQLRKLEIPIPPLPEQKAIVKILDEAFAKIDQAKANIEKNIENAKELFTNWTFLKFKHFNWNKENWEDVCHFIRGPFGGSLKKSMFVESGYAVYEQKQAIHNDYDALRYYIDAEKFKEMKRFKVKAADLLMSCSGVTLGRISEVPQNAPAGIINQALLKLTSNPSKILNDFLVIWIRSKVFQDLIFNVSGGAAQPNVPAVKILKKNRGSLSHNQRAKRIY